MKSPTKTLLLKSPIAIAFVAICGATYWATAGQEIGAPPWYAIVPPLLAITLALLTGRLLVSLAAAVASGIVLVNLSGGPDPLVPA